jgi:hypothetical protein
VAVESIDVGMDVAVVRSSEVDATNSVSVVEDDVVVSSSEVETSGGSRSG